MKDSGRKEQIQKSLCRSSQGMSMTAMIVVAVLELLMLGYTLINTELYGSLIWRYRTFYIFLLFVAVAYMIVSTYVKENVERRYAVMNVVNPLCGALFYAWSLVVTYSDYTVTGTVELIVFMTFSLVVPLGFYMSPVVYGVIGGVADAVMIWLILRSAGPVGLIINGSIFFIFQIVLGINYLRMKSSVALRVVEEQEKALLDVLTDCPNRRAYEERITGLRESELPRDMAYIAIDVDGLKEVNDSRGHEAGDRLIVGAARCIKDSFGQTGEVFRIGGDEFVVLIRCGRQALEESVLAYKAAMEKWTEENGLPLSTSCGYACAEDGTDGLTFTELARTADRQMYREKAEFYQMNGHDRRHPLPNS